MFSANVKSLGQSELMVEGADPALRFSGCLLLRQHDEPRKLQM